MGETCIPVQKLWESKAVVLDSLADMALQNTFTLVQIGQSSGTPQNRVISAYTQGIVVEGSFQQPFPRGFDSTVALNQGRGHSGVIEAVLLPKALALNLMRCENLLCRRKVRGRVVLLEMIVWNRRDGKRDIESVQERAADAMEIGANLLMRACAAGHIGIIAARTQIHAGDEHEIAGKGHAGVQPLMADRMIFHGKAQGLQAVFREFWEFIQEQDAEVSQTDYTWARIGPTASERVQRDCVMGR